MQLNSTVGSIAVIVAGLTAAHTASSAVIISELDAAGSSASYAADWFELTNTGSTAVSLVGWKMDDNSNSLAVAVALRNVSSLAAGQSVVFLEGTATGTGTATTSDAGIDAAFKSAWFGSSVPASLILGGYGGSGVGLSSTSDAVNIFDASGTLVTRVDFGASSSGTFDNTAGLNNVTLATHSVAGVNGAFTSASGSETGSPGVGLTPVPLPAAAWLLLGGLGGLTGFRRHRTATSR